MGPPLVLRLKRLAEMGQDLPDRRRVDDEGHAASASVPRLPIAGTVTAGLSG